jgi:hypothetical protein
MIDKNYTVECLDHGFVRLIDWMGSDLTVVNAARVSFNKRKDELDPLDPIRPSSGSISHKSADLCEDSTLQA